MPLLKLTDAHLAYGHVTLLDGVELQLDAGERVALAGRNGAGKSSLLMALAGQLRLDDGECWQQPGATIAYVAQEPSLDGALSVYETLVIGLGSVSALLEQYHALAQQLENAQAKTHDALLARLTDVQHALEAQGGWAAHVRVAQAIDRFGLDGEAQVAHLSGGGKKRLALACALAQMPDVLLLDEPTNHLDIGVIEWLENLLLETRTALLFITHDRRFLNRLATRVIELDRGQLANYPGDFATWQRRREARLNEEALAFSRADKLLRQEESWIRKGVEARRTRAQYRVQRLEQLRAQRAQRRDRLGLAHLRLDGGTAGGKLVAELTDVSKSFDGRVVVHDFSARLLRGDKIGVIGPNGIGKTTLLRLMLGEIAPDSGTVRRGTRLNIAYYDQFRTQLDPEAALIDVISPGSDFIEINGTRQHVIGYLETFLFSPQRARSPVKTLSGGERNRLLLARLFARPANVLVLDEPTNDLDIETLELLEQLLQDYAGTLFLVSHDRVFLDNVVTQVIAPVGDGRWLETAGGFSDWQAAQSQSNTSLTSLTIPHTPARPSPSQHPASAAPLRRSPGPASDKLTWKEARELESLPVRIEALETEQHSLATQISNPDLHQRGGQAAQQIARRLAEINAELPTLFERWQALEARNGRSP